MRDNHKRNAMSVSFELKGFSKKSFQYELLMIVSQKTHQNSQFDDTLKKVFYDNPNVNPNSKTS